MPRGLWRLCLRGGVASVGAIVSHRALETRSSLARSRRPLRRSTSHRTQPKRATFSIFSKAAALLCAKSLRAPAKTALSRGPHVGRNQPAGVAALAAVKGRYATEQAQR